MAMTQGCKAVLELKVRKFGNSLGVVLPKEVIARLRTRHGGRLYLIECPDGDYRLTSYDPSGESKMMKAKDIMDRYRNIATVIQFARCLSEEPLLFTPSRWQ